MANKRLLNPIDVTMLKAGQRYLMKHIWGEAIVQAIPQNEEGHTLIVADGRLHNKISGQRWSKGSTLEAPDGAKFYAG